MSPAKALRTWGQTLGRSWSSARSIRDLRGVQRVHVFLGIVLQYVPMCSFFRRLHAFLRRSWVFSRALGCGARRGHACAPRRKFWPRLGFRGRMLWALNVEIWQVNHGVAFRGARAEQDNGNPTRHLFCSTAAKALYLWQPRCATAVAHSSLRACAVCTLCYNSFPCL